MTTTAPNKTPSPAGEQQKPQIDANKVAAARSEFFAATLNMSWQLALVVLVPIIGGVQLDKLIDSAPAFLFVGFVMAMVGTGLVVWKQLQQLSPASEVYKK